MAGPITGLLSPDVQRSGLLPIGRNRKTGLLEFALPQAAVGLLQGIEMPGQAMRGEVNVMDPNTGHPTDQAIGRMADVAGVLAMGNAPAVGRAALTGVMPDPATLHTIPPSYVKQMPGKVAVNNSDELLRAVKNTPGAELTKDGVKLNVMRGQLPDQAGNPSTRGGVFYLPEGDKNARYYTGKGMNFAYGGSDKIKGETLFKRPLVIKR